MARLLRLPVAAALREYLVDLGGGAPLTFDPDDGQAPFRHVDLDEVILGHQGDRPAIDGLRRHMPDTGTAHGTRVAAIGHDRGRGVQDRVGGENRGGEVHLGHAVRARALVPYNHHVARCQFAPQQGIDRVILVLEDTGRPDMNVHLLGHRESLDHGAAWRKVAVEDGHTAVHSEWIRARPDNFILIDLKIVQVAAPFGKEERALLDLLEVLAERLAGNGEAVQMEQVSQFEHDGRDTTGIPEVLDRIPAGRLDVGQHRDPPVDAVEVIDGYLNPSLPGDRRDVEQCVGRPADGGVQDHGILERFTGQDGAWPDVPLD